MRVGVRAKARVRVRVRVRAKARVRELGVRASGVTANGAYVRG